MTGCATFPTKIRIAREILRKAIAEQLERSLSDGPIRVATFRQELADELLAAIVRPGIRTALQVLGCDQAE